jgi:hypothetical protein
MFPNSGPRINSQARYHFDFNSAKTTHKFFQESSKGGVIGAIMGGFGAMLGLGGGIVAVPALVGIAGFSQHKAIATSAAAVLISSMTGSFSYWENGNHEDSINVPAALLLASGGMLTSGLGAKVAGKMSSALLKRCLGYFVLISSPLILLRSYFGPKLDDLEKKESVDSFSSVSKFEVAQYLSLGACSGFISGMFGVGGGIIMVPLLSLILDHQQALGTSMTAMILPCLMGTLTHLKMGNVVTSILPSMMIGAGLGSWIGAKYSTTLDESQQRAICAVAFSALSFRYLGWVPKMSINVLPLLRSLKPIH